MRLENLHELHDGLLFVLQGFFNSSRFDFIWHFILLIVYLRLISRICSIWTNYVPWLHTLTVWPWGRVLIVLVFMFTSYKRKIDSTISAVFLSLSFFAQHILMVRFVIVGYMSSFRAVILSRTWES